MLEQLKQEVYQAHLELVKHHLVIYTWGNVSAYDEKTHCMVIKPSGVKYEDLTPQDMVVVDIETSQIVEGSLRPSSDTNTHIELYNAFPSIKAVTHTHSAYATAFAQAGRPIEALGTTHADYFYGAVPCTTALTSAQVAQDYETHTGKLIVQTIQSGKYNPLDIPAILVANHGPFTWGKNAAQAVYHAVVLENVAQMNLHTLLLNARAQLPAYILDKHYQRKHGKNAYYGQGK